MWKHCKTCWIIIITKQTADLPCPLQLATNFTRTSDFRDMDENYTQRIIYSKFRPTYIYCECPSQRLDNVIATKFNRHKSEIEILVQMQVSARMSDRHVHESIYCALLALWRIKKLHLWLYALFIDHTYMFRSPSATILRVYSIKGKGKVFPLQAVG